MIRTSTAGRAGTILLVLAPIYYLVMEAVSAAAWDAPVYDYAYHFVSDLGIPGPPSHVFGQDVNSPLAAVMNAGFIGYGILQFVAIALLLRASSGARAKLLLMLSAAVAVGIVLVGVFHGGQENIDDGTIVFHMLGAQFGIASGNLMSIFFGSFRARLGLSRAYGVTAVALGVIGLLGLVAFILDARGGINLYIGLFERLAIYPIVASHLVLGVTTLRSLVTRTTTSPAASGALA